MLLNSGLFFLSGLAGLWLGSELLIRAALVISRRLKVSETIIGLTILSIGTSLPEIFLSITGAIQQNKGFEANNIIVGSVMGSAISQIALILGIAGLIRVLRVDRKAIIKNGFFLLISTILFFVLSLDGLISARDGLILVGFYLIYLLSLRKRTKYHLHHNYSKLAKRGFIFAGFFLVLGFIVIAFSSNIVVTNSSLIANQLGISQMLLGVLLIGLSTSMPELMVSLNAAIKGSSGLSIGNIIGSNIVVMLVALGSSSLISGWKIDQSIISFDLPFLVLTTVIVIFFLLTKQALERKESFLMICLYFFYIFVKFRGI